MTDADRSESPADQNCGTCFFFIGDRKDRGHGAGECRRYPPRHKEPRFPEIDTSLWCGEYKAVE